MRIGSLFAGVGGLDLAVRQVFGGEHAWFSEIDPAASKVLAYRFPGVPNLGDITKIDWQAVEPVDVLCGGFPCQDVSAAGKRAGIKAGTRSGLWPGSPTPSTRCDRSGSSSKTCAACCRRRHTGR